MAHGSSCNRPKDVPDSVSLPSLANVFRLRHRLNVANVLNQKQGQYLDRWYDLDRSNAERQYYLIMHYTAYLVAQGKTASRHDIYAAMCADGKGDFYDGLMADRALKNVGDFVATGKLKQPAKQAKVKSSVTPSRKVIMAEGGLVEIPDEDVEYVDDPEYYRRVENDGPTPGAQVELDSDGDYYQQIRRFLQSRQMRLEQIVAWLDELLANQYTEEAWYQLSMQYRDHPYFSEYFTPLGTASVEDQTEYANAMKQAVETNRRIMRYQVYGIDVVLNGGNIHEVSFYMQAGPHYNDGLHLSEGKSAVKRIQDEVQMVKDVEGNLDKIVQNPLTITTTSGQE